MDQPKFARIKRNEFEGGTFGNKPPSFSNARDFEGQYQQPYIEGGFEPSEEIKEENKRNREFNPIMENR